MHRQKELKASVMLNGLLSHLFLLVRTAELLQSNMRARGNKKNGV